MTDRHTELAVFVTGFSETGYTWDQVRKEWNDTFPYTPWTYGDTRRFMADTKKAYRRVTGKPLKRGYLAS
jgi:hypothetical protein